MLAEQLSRKVSLCLNLSTRLMFLIIWQFFVGWGGEGAEVTIPSGSCIKHLLGKM